MAYRKYVLFTDYLKIEKLIKKELRVKAIDARAQKTLISHLSTQICLIQYFRSIFYFYLKNIYIFNRPNIKVRRLIQTSFISL